MVDETVFVCSLYGNLYAVDTETGQQEWVFETDSEIYSSPTVADGTLFTCAGGLVAMDAGVTGSSEGSRARLKTLGYHNDEPAMSISIDSAPGFGIGTGIAAVGATAYELKRQLTDDSESATKSKR